MSIPTGYEKLAVIGIAWKNEYVQGTAYKTMNAVYYNGSTYVALRDNPTGPPAADGANWQYLAKGFEQQLLSAITALDTSGVLGQAGATVGGQALMDAIADKVMTKLIAKSQIVNNLLATEPGNVLDATQGKALKDDITELYSDFADVANKVDATLLPKTDYVTNTAVFGSNWINLYQMSNLKLFIAFGTVKAVIPHHTIITLATFNGKYGGAGGGLCAETNDNFVKCHSWLVVSGSDILVQGYFDTDVPVGANMYFGGFWIN